MARTRDFLLIHLPVILYAGVIITLSSIPNLNPPPIKILAADANFDPDWMRRFGVARSSLSLLLIGWGVVADRRQHASYGWLHWLGLIAVIAWLMAELL